MEYNKYKEATFESVFEKKRRLKFLDCTQNRDMSYEPILNRT